MAACLWLCQLVLPPCLIRAKLRLACSELPSKPPLNCQASPVCVHMYRLSRPQRVIQTDVHVQCRAWRLS